MPSELPEIPEDKKQLVLEMAEKNDIGTIARAIFGDVTATGKIIDGRSNEAKAIKVLLAGEGIKPLTVEDISVPKEIILTEEQKAQIESLIPKFPNGNVVELAKIIFGVQYLNPASSHVRAVREHYRTIYPDGLNMSEEPVDEREWKPPVSLAALVGMVNRFVIPSGSRKPFNPSSLKPNERKWLESLMRYIRVYRFRYVASELSKQVDRDLFISTFVRWAYDKPDLTEIEVDQMISAAEETVNIASIGRDIRRIERMHEDIVSGNVTDENGRRVKLSQADVELINNIRTKHDASKKQLKDLMSKLETARSEREKERKDRYTSIIDLLEPWQKDSEFRDRMLQAGIEEKEEDKREVERMSGVEEIIALISGQSKEEAQR